VCVCVSERERERERERVCVCVREREERLGRREGDMVSKSVRAERIPSKFEAEG